MNIDSRHQKIIDDIIELQKDSDLYQEKIATLDKENQDLFSVNMKVIADNAALRKVLEACREEMFNMYSNDLSPSGTALDASLDKMLNLIEQTLSKGIKNENDSRE